MSCKICDLQVKPTGAAVFIHSGILQFRDFILTSVICVAW